MALSINNLSDLLKGHINGPVLNQTLTRLTAPGENLGSLMIKVDIIVKNKDREEIVYAVAKCVPPNKGVQALFNTSITFKNEIAWYTTIIPTMIEFQKKQGVKDVADFFMKIYGTRLSLDPNSEEIDADGVILSENLVANGYRNVDRRIGFNLVQAQEILKKLATFHAVTLALKLKEPEVFNLKVKKYLHKIEVKVDKNVALKSVIQFLEGHPETAHLVSRVQRALAYGNPEVEDIAAIREPWASAVHNDFWVNNIMLKEEEGQQPKVIILDLQICFYGSPIDDLLFFLGTSLQTDLAEKHFDELINLYYVELIKNLKSLNVETTLFSYESFQKELELQAVSQFGHCMLFVAMILTERGQASDSITDNFNPDDEMKKMFSTITEVHEKRYVLLTKEFAKRNWI